jgi:hypothetical protein
MGRRVATAAIAALLAAFATAWVLATEYREPAALHVESPRPHAIWPMSSGRASALRNDALLRAGVRVSADAPAIDLDILEPPLECRFLADLPSGTSPKFDCVLPEGNVIKVKYGRNPEVAAEVAATRLVSALGYAADRMSITPRVRCYGCPRYPFLAMQLLHLTGLFGRFPTQGTENGYSDFEWAAIERRFEASAIELPERKGWAWWELSAVDPARGATRTELDALRLLAVFLAHWDNKAENQRMVCLDAPGAIDRSCGRPLLMIQDLGATFGPPKANLARWQSTRIWADRNTCTVSMRALPYHGGTFPEVRITEGGRLDLLERLSALTPDQVRDLFRAARFPEHYSATDDDKDVEAWSDAFWQKVDQIATAGPCPTA